MTMAAKKAVKALSQPLLFAKGDGRGSQQGQNARRWIVYNLLSGGTPCGMTDQQLRVPY
jgi:hypothetical protein